MALFTTLVVRGDVYPKELEQMAMENLQRVVGLFLAQSALYRSLYVIICIIYRLYVLAFSSSSDKRSRAAFRVSSRLAKWKRIR